jgi:hypothetical protein
VDLLMQHGRPDSHKKGAARTVNPRTMKVRLYRNLSLMVHAIEREVLAIR